MLSTYELWNVLAGRASVIEPDAIGEELKNHGKFFKEGLSYYKKPCSTSETKLKSAQVVKRKEFLLRLSQFLNVDQWQTHELFQTYLRLEFRGSGPQLQAIIKHEGQLDGFLLKLLHFYFNERLYLLKCIKYIFSYWKVQSCLYQKQFAKTVDELINENIISKLIDALDEKFKQLPNHEAINNNFDAQVAFTTQFIKEQNELCDIIFLYYNDFDMPLKVFQKLANLFRTRHFGKSQVARKFMDKNGELMTERFGYISSLILLEGLDIEMLRKSFCEGKMISTKHHMAKSNVWQTIDELLYSWDDVKQQGPVLVAWSIFRHISLPASEQELTSYFADSAMKCSIVEYISDLVSSEFVKNKMDPLCGLVKTVLYTLMSLMLKIFQTASLGVPETLVEIVANILKEGELPHLMLTDDINGGIASFVKSTQNLFPMAEVSYLKLLFTLCADLHTSSVVYELMEQQSLYTELFGRNRENEIESIANDKWKRLRERVLIGYINDGLILPTGTEGKIYSFRNEVNFVSWSFEYSGWLYLLLEFHLIAENLMTYTNDSGEDGITIASSLLDLISSILEHDESKLNEFDPFVATAIDMLRQCFELESMPLLFVKSCLKCLSVVAIHLPIQIWHQLTDIQFLPTCDSFDADMPSLNRGHLGSILRISTPPEMVFSIVKEYLHFVKMFLKAVDFSQMEINDYVSYKKMYTNIAMNLVFILQEIFTGISNLHFSNMQEKIEIGCCCLEIFFFVLSPSFVELKSEDSKVPFPSLKALVHELLVSHGQCEALLSIATIGVDGIENLYNDSKNEKIIQLVKLSLSVLNTLLNLQDVSNTSPLHTCLSQQFIEQPSDFNFIQPSSKETAFLILAKYIYHKTDPKLPILSILVMRSIAKTFPMVLTSSFGDSLHGLCNAFVNNLNSLVNSIRLKIVIIEFLTTCIETQPGIIESFSRLTFSKDTGEYTVGKFSCLNPIFSILEDKDNFDILTVTALQFVANLWSNRYDIAMSVLKKKASFWDIICHPLKNHAQKKNSKIVIDMVHHVLEIVLVEFYYVKEDQLSKELKQFMESSNTKLLYTDVIQLLRPVDGVDLVEKQLQLMKTWSSFLSVMTKTGYGGFNDRSVVLHVLHAWMDLINEWLVDYKTNKFYKDVLVNLADTFLFMCHRWKTLVSHSEKVLTCINTCLYESAYTDNQLLDVISLPFYTAATIYLNGTSQDISDEELIKLTKLICQHLLHQLKALSLSNNNQTDFNKKIIILGIQLLCNIKSHVISSMSGFVHVIKEHDTTINLITSLETHIKKEGDIEFIEATLLLFSKFSQDEKLARHLMASGINTLLCLSLEGLHKWKNQWQLERIWSIAFVVSSNLLKTLRYSYIEQSLDFLGAHKEHILKGTNVIEQLTKGSKLILAEKIGGFLYEMCSYQSELIFALQTVFEAMKEKIVQMVSMATALLSRQRVLSHILECGNEKSIVRLLSRTQAPSPTSFRSDSVKSSHADVNTIRSPKMEEMQNRLINILISGVSSMRRLTPNVAQTILDGGMDIDSFYPLVSLNFSSPSLDADHTPSFGTLVSTLNVSLKLIQKMSQCDSDRTTPEKDFTFNSMNEDESQKRCQLWYLIDGLLVVLISQAMCYLRQPAVDEREKQFLKRELGSELSNFVYAVQRLRSRRGIPVSPLSSEKSNSSGVYRRSPSKLSICFSEEDENSLLKVADVFTKTLLK